MNKSLLQFDHSDVEIIAKNRKYNGFFALDEFQLRHKLYQGGYSNVITREVFERGDAVAILPYDVANDKIVLIEQFRAGAIRTNTSPWQLEIIAGMFEKHEQPIEVAIREAKEEANLVIEPDNIKKIMEYLSSSGAMTECIHLYYANVDSYNIAGVYGVAEENEDILVHVLPRTEVIALLQQGKITNAATIIALQWFMLNFDQLKCEN